MSRARTRGRARPACWVGRSADLLLPRHDDRGARGQPDAPDANLAPTLAPAKFHQSRSLARSLASQLAKLEGARRRAALCVLVRVCVRGCMSVSVCVLARGHQRPPARRVLCVQLSCRQSSYKDTKHGPMLSAPAPKRRQDQRLKSGVQRPVPAPVLQRHRSAHVPPAQQ